MKRVSFKVAKALRGIGYPQDKTDKFYVGSRRYDKDRTLFEGSISNSTDNRGLLDCDIPTYLEVWLWLWKEKNIKIPVTVNSSSLWISDDNNMYHNEGVFKANDPEESIITAIEHLVDNNLIK